MKKMHSKDIFLPSFDFVNNKIIDNTKYSEKSTNKYFPNSYFMSKWCYIWKQLAIWTKFLVFTAVLWHWVTKARKKRHPRNEWDKNIYNNRFELLVYKITKSLKLQLDEDNIGSSAHFLQNGYQIINMLFLNHNCQILGQFWRVKEVKSVFLTCEKQVWFSPKG